MAEPHSGHEIGRHAKSTENIRRPFIVLSNSRFNRVSQVAICMPMTHQIYRNRSGYVPIIDTGSHINGSIITFKPVIYDLFSRNVEVKGHINDKKILKELVGYIIQSLS